MNYFEELNILPLKEELYVEENIVLEEYVEIKEENIEISKEINEGLVIEEEPEIKIVEEINEDPIIEKDLEVKIVETIKKETIEEVVNDLDDVKLDDCNVQAPIILVGSTETKYIDFIGVERFDLIIESYLVNIFNCMKIKGKEVQVAQVMTFKFGKNTKKMKNSKYLFSWHGRFHISTINSRTSLFQVEGFDVGHNLQINLCNLLFLVFLCNFRYFRFRAIISLFLSAFNAFYIKFGSCYG